MAPYHLVPKICRKHTLQSLFSAFSPFILFLTLGFTLFPSAGRDDAHITYWAAHALAKYGEIVNYSGDRVEQSSSLLHTILLAATAHIWNDSLVSTGRFLSITGGLLAIWLTGRLASAMDVSAAASRLLCATAVPLLYWSFGGLETTLVAVALLSFVLTFLHVVNSTSPANWLWLVISTAAYLTIRPEAFFVLIAFYALLFISCRSKNFCAILLLKGLAIASVIFALLTLWRLQYFDAAFPQPVTAKTSQNILANFLDGLKYLINISEQYPPIIIFSIAPLIYTWQAKQGKIPRFEAVLLAIIIANAAFVVASGGDWMEGARFIAPIIPFLIILSLKYISSTPNRHKFTIIFTLFHVASIATFMWFSSTSVPIFYVSLYQASTETKDFSFFEFSNRVHFRDIPVVRHLRSEILSLTKQGIKPVVLSIQAGMVPFHVFREFYGRARFIDGAALTTRDFTDCPLSRTWGSHETGLKFDYARYLSQRPELEKICGLRRPDIIFDLDGLGNSRAAQISSADYKIVYTQDGNLRRHRWPPGAKLDASEFIAVRRKLLYGPPTQ